MIISGAAFSIHKLAGGLRNISLILRMELRSCSNLHFIQAIKAGLVEKVRNIDSRGRPALVFKKLEDIYVSEDAKRIDSISKPQSQGRFADMLFDCDKVKTESLCLPLVERKTKERYINMDGLNCNSDDNKEGDHIDDFDFGKMTLKQLKKRCKTKKRKALRTVCSSPKQEYTDWQPGEDECDLEEPIIHIWKSKFSKNLKGKRNRAKKCPSSPSQTDALVDSKQILNAEDSLQPSVYFPAHINAKVEVSETESSECINTIHSANDTITGSSELLELKSEEQISLTEECLNCVVNKISYDHLEHTEPTCLPFPIGGETMEADNLKKTCQQQVLVLPISDIKREGYGKHPLREEESMDTSFPVKCQSSDMCSNSQSYSSVQEISRQGNCISGVQAPAMADDNLYCTARGSAGNPCGFEGDIDETLAPNLEIDSLNSPSSNCSSSQNSNPCSSPDIVLVPMEDDPPAYEKPIVLSVSIDAAKNNLSPIKNPVAFGDSSTAVEKKQPLRSGPDDLESNSPRRNLHLEVHELPLLETKKDPHLKDCHPPERLLSTRKAISPTSQEKLCQAMKVELKEEIDHYKCKEKLQFDKEIKNKSSPEGVDAEVVELNLNSEGLTEATRIKVAMSPKPITKKPKTDRKVSPPKVIRRSLHDSCSPPDVRTGATFTQSCSERVIAFSQRQMHDIECLAMKLMEELRSMKDIVEGKLHPEASPTRFLEYDEVKTAINSATKVEGTTRKWLSMMARDCSRFCKLMRTETGEVSSGITIQKKRKRISFADEAGGVLCHVKVFEDSEAPLDSGFKGNTT